MNPNKATAASQEPAMTEQPPSAEAKACADEIGYSWPAIEHERIARILDRFAERVCEQRVSAETVSWQTRDRQRLEQIGRLQETVQSLQSAQAERPAPERPQPSLSTLRPCCRTVCPEWPECGCGRPGASPADVMDYTERARAAMNEADRDIEILKDVPGFVVGRSTYIRRITEALSAVASERDAAAIRVFGKRVWSDTEEVAYQAGVSDTRAKLQEPEVREAVAKATWDKKTAVPWDQATAVMRDRELVCADAALTKIAEMLK